MFAWSNPYPTVRAPVFARNLVATSQPLAAQAGLRMLHDGGNAVDAALAAAAVLTLVEPCSNGLGSDNFAIVWDPASRALHGLNASGTAPAAWTRDYFDRKYGADARPTRGWDTVTVPGAVAGWSMLHRRFGSLAFDDVLAPAIDYAERGFAVSPIDAGQMDARRAGAEVTTRLCRTLPAARPGARGRRTLRAPRRRAHAEADRRVARRCVLSRRDRRRDCQVRAARRRRDHRKRLRRLLGTTSTRRLGRHRELDRRATGIA
jgi:hypothetical protein